MKRGFEHGLVLVFAVAACALLAAGCIDFSGGSGDGGAPGGGTPDGGQWRGGGGGPRNASGGFGNFTNMTLEQRQAFEQERTQAMQAAAAACEGKAQGEACVVQNARDGSARSGTCESRNASNGTLACLVARLNLPNG